MLRRPLLTLCVLGALLAVPQGAAAAVTPPVVTSVTPLTTTVGSYLTIRGRNFIPGRMRNTVAFQRLRARAVFVRADFATSRYMRVRIPAKLLPFLVTRAGSPLYTRFRIRVLSRRFALYFTPTLRSPLIGPPRLGAPTGGIPGAVADCDSDGIPNSAESDDDNDLLEDALESSLRLDPCKVDTDGDFIEDGYEYFAARDLNISSRPYPGKRPYPNPLDGTDATIDHDGDVLTLAEEYVAWARYGNRSVPLNFSAGTQFSGGPGPVTEPQLDLDGSGGLSDDEKDPDSDGVTNYDETHGRLTPGYWKTYFKEEGDYQVAWAGTDFVDHDSDGDGTRDGDDDQDFDDWTNIQEVADRDASHRWNQPFNSCLPDYQSRTCARYPPACEQAYAPFRCEDVRESRPLGWPRPTPPPAP